MTREEANELLVVGRGALKQALSQWKMYADEEEGRNLGHDGEMEDDFYNGCRESEMRLGAAADEVEDARIAGKTAFASSAWLGSVGLERRAESGESSGMVGAGGVDKLRVGEESLAGMKALARNDFLTAAYRFDQAKVACLLLGGYDPIAMGGGGAELVRERAGGTAEKLPNQAFAGYAALPERTGADVWEVLGITPSASEAEIMEAYRSKAKAAHPDKGGSHELFAALSQAKDIALATARSRGA